MSRSDFPIIQPGFFHFLDILRKKEDWASLRKKINNKKNSSSPLSVSPRKTWAPESPAKGRRVASTASNTCTSIKSGVVAFVAGTTTLLAVIRTVFKWSSWSTSLFFWFCTALCECCFTKRNPVTDKAPLLAHVYKSLIQTTLTSDEIICNLFRCLK